MQHILGLRRDESWDEEDAINRVSTRCMVYLLRFSIAYNPFGIGFFDKNYNRRQKPFVETAIYRVSLVRPQHELIRPKHELIRPQHELIRSEHELIRPKHELIRPQHELIRSEHNPIRPEHELIRPQHELIRSEHNPIRPEHELIVV